MKPYLAGLFLLGMLAYSAGTARADLITDGGFEADTPGLGSPSSGAWALSNTTFNSGVNEGPSSGGGNVGPHSGSNWFGLGDPSINTLSQSVTTVAGVKYTLTYWVALKGSNTGDQFSASWNGTNIVGSTITSTANGQNFAYTAETFTVTGTGGSNTLAFSAFNTPSFWELDDVSLLAPVPEPSSMALGGLAALGMILPIGWKWRRAKKTNAAATPQPA